MVAILLLAAANTTPVQNISGFPDHVRVVQGELREFPLGLPLPVHIRSGQSGGVEVNGRRLAAGTWDVISRTLALKAEETGRFEVEMRLLGWIPLRTVTVDVLPPIRVMPSGQAVGVMLQSNGVMIVREAPVLSEKGQVFPARDAGVRVGDVIMAINGEVVYDKTSAAEAINAAGRGGKPVSLEVRRHENTFTRNVRPVYDTERHRYLIGVWIRDGAQGVGTLTFYDNESSRYGALGHVITDSETGQPYSVEAGQVVAAIVSGIRPGQQGHSGEKIGAFDSAGGPIGNIEKNTPFGIFGTLDRTPKSLYRSPIPVGLEDEIRPGPAEIVTVIEDQQLERFDIVVERVIPQASPEAKSMIIRITDPRLLDETGGIIQGMSGSPIIQNGKFIGAVTHVFVNDPQRGYGVSAEWMIQESGILDFRRREREAPQLTRAAG